MQDVLCYVMAGISLLLIVLVIAMLQPYKSTKVNNYHISIQLILAIACFLITLFDQANIMDRWLINILVQLIGVTIISPILIATFIIIYKVCRKIKPGLQNLMLLENTEVPSYSEINISEREST